MVVDRGQGTMASHDQPGGSLGANRPGWIYTSVLGASNYVLQAHGKLLASQTVWDVFEDVGLGQQELSDYEHREYLDTGASGCLR